MNTATSPTGWARNPDGSPGYTWNPLSGCLNHDNGLCKGGGFPCYAYKLANGRLKNVYRVGKRVAPLNRYVVSWKDVRYDPFYPRFWEDRLAEMTKRNDRLWYDGKKTKYAISPRGIFVCDMGDLFGVGVPEQWTEKVLDEIWGNKGYDRFYILTKQAQRLPEFSPFPDNAWIGVTATNTKAYIEANEQLAKVEAKVKYLSLEPLLEKIDCFRLPPLLHSKVSWLIIGACTGTKEDMLALTAKYLHLTVMPSGKKWIAQPKIEDLREIVEVADKAGVKVFLKDNLKPLLLHEQPFVTYDYMSFKNLEGKLRQEMPI